MQSPAQQADVVVIGTGLPALVAARECALIGARVLLLEQSAPAAEHVDGRAPDATDRSPGDRHDFDTTAPTPDAAQPALDAPADGFDPAQPDIGGLLGELGLDRDVVPARPLDTWLHTSGSGITPEPAGSLLGIPSYPLATDVVRIIGWNAALRAWLDRLKPVLTIGRSRNLGSLVRERMGPIVLHRLVTPVVSCRFGVAPDRLDADVIDPELNNALSRLGSLSGAVAELGLAIRSRGPVESGLPGGPSRLTDALTDSFRVLDVQRLTARVETVRRDSASPLWQLVLADGTAVHAQTLIVATGQGEALRLLNTAEVDATALSGTPNATAPGTDPGDPGPAAITSDPGWGAERDVTDITLLIDETPDAPVPPADVFSASTQTALRLTNLTAKWKWLERQVHDGGHRPRHVLRLTYIPLDDTTAPRDSGLPGPADAPPHERALRDLIALLPGTAARTAASSTAHRTQAGLHSASPVVIGVRRRTIAPAYATLGRAKLVARLRQAVAGIPGLEVTGSWLSGDGPGDASGTGHGTMIADAREAAGRTRGELIRHGFGIRP